MVCMHACMHAYMYVCMYGTAQRQRRTRCLSRARRALALDLSLQVCN